MSSSHREGKSGATVLIFLLNFLKEKKIGLSPSGSLEVSTPEFDPEHIVSIVEFIIEAGDRETYDIAAEICNTYGKRGYDLLRDTYEKYKK